jgi:hypothetical protein
MSVKAASAYLVEFVGVGHARKCWKVTTDKFPDEGDLARMVRKAKALASRGIDCQFDEDMEHGTVLVGGFRPVGAFRVTERREAVRG